jgi:hypothetical protein
MAEIRERKVTIERTPGGHYFVRIDPPFYSEPTESGNTYYFPSRSFSSLKEAQDYKWRVELEIHSSSEEEHDDQ